ncbi:acyltransferase family protein [Pseudovibrio sp. Tun.PSC04-5.I4]|uniref:acyltransferase family protein n=1 Tax=Pseudovibrio sp. Tun.PSC04-5.I4 TaxID=1798213 RepID=UPI00088B3B72|nr:acyltransferase family protein [Pseudovibrio sp. Tun.PSC04-5.I4]SDR31211.1 Peptidoglycan/LPS O-acetylase OafA/YrhL, contains acyltransferase and SGNH-hydrolase domains [Pseudovibrio sp. Tun.PSC04-5.I4]
MQYRREIDGLRSLAIIPVVLFHAGVPVFSGGYVGVDIFFVISGFLITRIILRDLEVNRFSFWDFSQRRVRRIFPALFVVLVISFSLAWIIQVSSDFNQFAKSIVSVATFTSNFFFYKQSGYFDGASELKPLLHMWSLAVEEQFYIFFPIYLYLIWKFSRERILVLLMLIAVLSFTAASIGVSYFPDFSFYLLPTRAWELLLGAIAAFVDSRSARRMESDSLSFLGIGMIAFSVFYFDRQTPFPGYSALAPTFGAFFIILFAGPNTFCGRLLSFPVSVGLGLISYSLYLWHQPVFAFYRLEFGVELSTSEQCILIMICLLMAILSWRYIETPTRAKRFLPNKKILFAGFAISISFIVAGRSIILLKVADYKLENFASLLTPPRSSKLQLKDKCFLLSASVDTFDLNSCFEGYLGEGVNVLIVGDSHAASLYPGLKLALNKNNISLYMLTAAYCLPLITDFPSNVSETATPRCSKINHQVRKTIGSMKFDLVLISSHISEWGFSQNLRWTYPGYYRDFLEVIDQLKLSQKLVVVNQFPIWPGGLPNVLERELKATNYRSEELSRYSENGLDDKFFSVDEKLQLDASSVGVGVISPAALLCIEKMCQRFVKYKSINTAMSFDYGHLSLAGSLFLGKAMVPAITEYLH